MCYIRPREGACGPISGRRRVRAALIDTHIVRHTANFTYESPDGVKAGGSGVLAYVGDVRGVLTCGHVLRAIRSHKVKPGQGLLGLAVNTGRLPNCKQ
jgi:hypothetical protein